MDLSQQWPYICQVANQRLANNKTERHVAEYGPYIEVIGAAGELAARHFLQLPEELHTTFDSGADMLFRNIRVDVKATIWTPKLMEQHLQWPAWKQIKADVILFTAIKMKTRSAVIAGYVLPHDIESAPLNPERKYQCYEIPVTRLRKASELLFAECKDDLYPGAQARTPQRRHDHHASA